MGKEKKEGEVAAVTAEIVQQLALAEDISVRAEWLGRTRRALSVPSDTPWWWITLRLASIQCIVLHIAL